MRGAWTARLVSHRKGGNERDIGRRMRPEEYHKLADLEERMWFFRAYQRRFVRWFSRTLPRGPARLLDAGCGTGGTINALRQANREWTVDGLDYSPIACALARTRTAATITEGSVTAMPVGSGAYDGIVSADVVCQVDDPALAVREFARCLRSGGVVQINAPAYMWLWSHHDRAVHSVRRFTRRELVGHCRGAGLEIVYASYANSFLLPAAIVRRKLFPPRRPTSDVALLPAPIETCFSALAWLEFQWTARGGRLPAGLSVFVVARKP